MGGNGKKIYLGRKEIMSALGVGDWRTVVKWINKRSLPVLREPGYPPSIHVDDLKQWHEVRKDKYQKK